MTAPSTSTALVTLEQQLRPLAPRFEAALAGMMPVERLIRTVLVSVERLPALLNCDRQSIFMAAMSAACLGLEVDGITGQAFLIPFKNRAQLVIGYKGLSTLAARSGITVQGDVVREGDAFDFKKGSGAFVDHRPLLTDTDTRRVIAAWATAEHRDRPPVVEVMGIDEIMAVKGRSPGAKRSDSPWNDPKIGFPAMAAKTAKRRLWRSLPLNTGAETYQMAARMDEAVDEQGAHAYITPDRGLEIDSEAEAATPYENSPTPDSTKLIGADAPSIDAYESYVQGVIEETTTAAELGQWWNSAEQKEQRRVVGLHGDRMNALIATVSAEITRRQDEEAANA